MKDKYGLVANLPGGVPRLPLHGGAIKGCLDIGVDEPDEIIGSSGGAIAGSGIIGWNKEASEKYNEAIGNLSPDQIFSYRRSLKLKLAALGITTVGFGLLVLFDHKLSKSKKAALGLAGLATLLATDTMVGNELIHSESNLSAAPLKHLLHSRLDFNAIFKSPIRLGVVVADAAKPGEVIFSNHHPLNSDPNNPEHRERWVNILLASARLPGKFPFIQIDGINTVDGEVWTDFPIRQMKKYKKIIRFDYWPPLQPDKAPREWMSDLSRSFDVMRDRCTQKKIEYYELERKSNPELPEIYYVRLSPKLAKQLPHIRLHDFIPEQMRVMEEIAYDSVVEQRSAILSYLEK